MSRLTFIRHGQTPSNVLGLLDTGAPGPGLTESGLQQAAALPGLLADASVDGLYVSRLVRTHLTARPLAVDRAVAPVELPGVHEIEAGSLELRSDENAVRSYMETAFAWGVGDLDARMPDGPDGHEFFGRFDADVERAIRESADPVIVSHGAAIRVWVARHAANIEPAFTAEHHLPNAGIVELEGSSGSWRLLTWPDAPVTEPDPIDRELDLQE